MSFSKPDLQPLIDKISALAGMEYTQHIADLRQTIPAQLEELIILSENIETSDKIKKEIEEWGTAKLKASLKAINEFNKKEKYHDDLLNKAIIYRFKDDVKAVYPYYFNLDKEWHNYQGAAQKI